MSRKKETPKPMFALRADFAASLENVCNECVMMLQMVDSLIQLGNLTPNLKAMLIERRGKMRAALMSENDDDEG
jgi:hypothetical protein